MSQFQDTSSFEGNNLDEVKTLYDSEFSDLDNMLGEPVDLNPRYYLHFSVLKLQNCFLTTDLKEGIVRFNLLVNHIETIAIAAALIRDMDNYKESINKENPETKEEKKDIYIEHKIANTKLRLILKEVFINREMRLPMNLRSKNVKKEL